MTRYRRFAGWLAVYSCGGALLAASALTSFAQNSPAASPPASGRTTTSSGIIIHPAAPPVTVSMQSFGSPFTAPQVGGPLEPAHPHLTQMLMRSDVTNELFLNGRQADALEAMKAGAGEAIRQQAADLARRIQALKTGGSELSDGERIAQAKQAVADMVQERAAQENDADKRAIAILRPEQIRRLVELELQWRGAMALSDPNMAETLQLTDSQRALVKEQTDTFLKAQAAALAAAKSSLVPAPLNAEGASARVQTQRGASVEVRSSVVQLTPQQTRERDMKMIEALKPAQKVRAQAESKILAALTPAQGQQWKALMGKPFTFRTNL